MIELNELRIGNWIKLHVAGNFKVKEIKQSNVVFYTIEDKGFYDYSILYGIGLTPEILEKCGYNVSKIPFDQDYTLYGKDDDTFYLEFDWRKRDNGYCPLIHTNEFHTMGVNVKYVHQLQNLHYSFTGEELNINF